MVTRSPNDRRRGFTLIELLVVIGIMGILMGAAVVAFQNMSKGSAMRSSVMQVRTALALARQWAITHRENTYLVFPDAVVLSTGEYTPPIEINKAYRSFNIYTASDKYLREWTTLPQGVAFGRNSNIFQGTDTKYRLANLPFLGTNNVAQMIVIGFKPDGTPLISDIYAPPVLEIVDAVVDVVTGTPSTVTYNYRGNGNTNYLEISAMVGLVKVLEK